jgi:SulP family sulfate permease
MRHVPAIDATGLRALDIMIDKFQHKGVRILLSGVQPQPMKAFYTTKLMDKVGLDNICGDIHASLARARKILAE